MQKGAFPSVYTVELQYAGTLIVAATPDQGLTSGKALC